MELKKKNYIRFVEYNLSETSFRNDEIEKNIFYSTKKYELLPQKINMVIYMIHDSFSRLWWWALV